MPNETVTIEQYIINQLGITNEESNSQQYMVMWMLLQDTVENLFGVPYTTMTEDGYDFWNKKPITELDDRQKMIIDRFIQMVKKSPPPDPAELCGGCEDRHTCDHIGNPVDKDKLN